MILTFDVLNYPRLLVMRVIVLDPYTKLEVRIGLPVSKIWLIFGHCVWLWPSTFLIC